MLRYKIEFIDGNSEKKILYVEVQDKKELKDWLQLLEKIGQAKKILKYERKTSIIE
tara:strand:+ start:884 stop:1051 length:168 start_codon:yes stop_codon:yes gene_type:complete